MAEEQNGQAPSSQNDGGGPEQPEQQTEQQNDNLVDVTERDDAGNLQWFDQKYVKGLRDEAATNRKALKEAQKLLEAARKTEPDAAAPPQPPATTTTTPPQQPATLGADAQIQQRMSELETLIQQHQTDVTQAAARARQSTIDAAVIAVAAKATDDRARFIDPSDAVRLIDMNEITVGDDGAVDAASVAKVVNALAKDKAHLLEPKRRGARLPESNPDGSGHHEGPTIARLRAQMQGKGDTFGSPRTD